MLPARVVAMQMLTLEVAHLSAIYGWEPAGSLLGRISDVAMGHDGFTQKEVARLRRWARRWGALDERLQAFYAAEVRPEEDGSPRDPSAVDAALWSILEGEERPSLSRAQLASLKVRWVARYGAVPSVDLAPKPRE